MLPVSKLEITRPLQFLYFFFFEVHMYILYAAFLPHSEQMRYPPHKPFLGANVSSESFVCCLLICQYNGLYLSLTIRHTVPHSLYSVMFALVIEVSGLTR